MYLPKKKTVAEIVDEVAEKTLALFEENKVPLDQCIGVGVGVPGTIDRRNGRVIYHFGKSTTPDRPDQTWVNCLNLFVAGYTV